MPLLKSEQDLIDSYLRIPKNKIGDFYMNNISLSMILENVIDDLSDLIDEKKAKIRLHEMHFIKGNYFLLRLLFQNIIENAILHCKESSPQIEIGQKNIQNKTIIAVTDNGPGIDDAVIDHLFAPRDEAAYANLDLEQTSGLDICMQIMKFHQGSMSFNYNQPQGTIVGLVFNN